MRMPSGRSRCDVRAFGTPQQRQKTLGHQHRSGRTGQDRAHDRGIVHLGLRQERRTVVDQHVDVAE
jgi:hypothetical protein